METIYQLVNCSFRGTKHALKQTKARTQFQIPQQSTDPEESIQEPFLKLPHHWQPHLAKRKQKQTQLLGLDELKLHWASE